MSMRTTCAIVGQGYAKDSWPAIQHMDAKRKKGIRTTVQLVREPENRYDANAVAVLGQDSAGKMVRVGYIPRGDARVVARVMDGGAQIQAHYDGNLTVRLYWLGDSRESEDAAYRRAMAEGEGL